MVKVAEINIRVGVGRELMLGLSDEKFMFGIGEILALIGIKVDVVTIDLGCGSRGETVTALYTNLYIVKLKSH